MVQPKWRIDPSISWGDLGMAAGLFLTGVLAFTDLSSEVSVHNERINAIGTGTNAVHAELRQHIQVEAAEREAVRLELRGDLKEINLKLDKLIERELKHTTGH